MRLCARLLLLLLALNLPLAGAEDWRSALKNWENSRKSERSSNEPEPNVAEDQPAQPASSNDLSTVLRNWQDGARQQRKEYLESYHPDYKTVPLADWISLKSRLLEMMIERPLSKLERAQIKTEFQAEHEKAEGRLFRRATHYEQVLAAALDAEHSFLERAHLKRAYSDIYYAWSEADRATSAFWDILQKVDPVIRSDSSSGTLLTRHDIRAYERFARATSSGWAKKTALPPRLIDAVRQRYATVARQSCTQSARKMSLAGALARAAGEQWSAFSGAERKALRAFIMDDEPISAVLLKRLTGLASLTDLYAMAGVHFLDPAERRTVEAAGNATALMVGDPTGTLAVVTPAISGAWAKQMARCAGR